MKILTIDDTKWGNLIIAQLLEKHQMKDHAIFFASFNDDNNPEDIIRILARKGCVIGSHTISHPHLDQVSFGRVEYELRQSKKQIERITNKKCVHFAYPHGGFSDEVIEQVKEAGYKMARTCEKQGDSVFKTPSFFLDGRNWKEAMETDLQYYHLHFESLLLHNSIEQLDKFILS